MSAATVAIIHVPGSAVAHSGRYLDSAAPAGGHQRTACGLYGPVEHVAVEHLARHRVVLCAKCRHRSGVRAAQSRIDTAVAALDAREATRSLLLEV